MYTNKQLILSITLVVVILVSGYYTISTWQKNKSEIIVYLSDAFETIALPYKMARLSTLPPDEELILPIHGVNIDTIEDTWGAARAEGRTHEGVDIFAPRGEPVNSATSGYVLRVGTNNLGGNIVFVYGNGGVRYYYAHLDRIAQGLKIGTPVTSDTVLGYVGNTGNASNTPPHLHFGMYINGAQNPYHLLVSR